MIDIKKMVRQARYRAALKGIPFNVLADSLIVPIYCPILGLKLEPAKGAANDSSPTLDRIDPKGGYVSGNVLVISNLANRIKSNAKVTDIGHMYTFLSQPSLNKKDPTNGPIHLQRDPILDGPCDGLPVGHEYHPDTDHSIQQPLYHDSGTIPAACTTAHPQARLSIPDCEWDDHHDYHG